LCKSREVGGGRGERRQMRDCRNREQGGRSWGRGEVVGES
jgi:hypothetical protein